MRLLYSPCWQDHCAGLYATLSVINNTETLAMLMHSQFLVQIMAAIGEQFTEGEEICGIVVNLRARQDRLCIWTKTASNEAAQVGFMRLT